ncbi:MAG: gluconate 2-dehydrogenase subunit 3 family protein [Acidobacteriota bacterium]
MTSNRIRNRRQVIKELATGVTVLGSLPVLDNHGTAQHHHFQSAALGSGSVQAPKFFNKRQYATVAELASLIIPSDETPGAREAKVEEYIDLAVGDSTFEVQKVCLDGLVWLDNLSRKRHGKRFVHLRQAQQIAILTEISRESDTRDTLAARFFKTIKDLTIDGFYTSRIGLEELGYIGNTALDEFPGCTHPEHQTG